MFRPLKRRLGLVLALSVVIPQIATTGAATKAEQWSVCFTPPSGCAQVVARLLDEARRSIRIQAYVMTSDIIARSLLNAAKRGVDVVILLDKSNRTSRYSAADFYSRAGIPVKIDSLHAIAHNKVIVIDESTVVTGSFNFTKAADTRNAENLLIVRDAELTAKYLENWRTHDRHSEDYISSNK